MIKELYKKQLMIPYMDIVYKRINVKKITVYF